MYFSANFCMLLVSKLSIFQGDEWIFCWNSKKLKVKIGPRNVTMLKKTISLQQLD